MENGHGHHNLQGQNWHSHGNLDMEVNIWKWLGGKSMLVFGNSVKGVVGSVRSGSKSRPTSETEQD